MFKNLRKKMNAVLPDIENMYLSNTHSTSPSASVNPLGIILSSVSAENIRSKSSWSQSSAINLSAGCTLLNRNEKIWEDLNLHNEQNAKRAERCDFIIENITDNVNKRLIDLSDINVSLESIPHLIQTIESCSNIMHDINEKCIDVEKQLFELEDLIELLQLQEKQLDSKFDMAMFKERKLAHLETIRQSLALKHAETVRESERKMRILQQERQAAFQDAFQSDLNYYKEIGKIPKIESKTLDQSLSLEEIVLDDELENNELNKFLDDAEM